VIVNGLNLGSTFRTQFEQSAQQYGGDLDQVIANWSSEIEVETAEGPAEAAAAQ
jgi:phospholipid transport system substrate-binding protein